MGSTAEELGRVWANQHADLQPETMELVAEAYQAGYDAGYDHAASAAVDYVRIAGVPWSDVLEAVRRRSRVTAMMLSDSKLVSVDDETITVELATSGHVRSFPGRAVVLQEALMEVCRRIWLIQVTARQ